MRKCVFLIVIIFVSCSTSNTLNMNDIVIYRSYDIGNLKPNTLILNKETKMFNFYYSLIMENVVGSWEIKGDTLLLYPQYEYYKTDMYLRMQNIEGSEPSMTTIEQKYVIRDNGLIDVTDYTKLVKFNFERSSQPTYYKVSK